MKKLSTSININENTEPARTFPADKNSTDLLDVKYFKTPSGEVHGRDVMPMNIDVWMEDVPDGWLPISKDEAVNITDLPPTKEQQTEQAGYQKQALIAEATTTVDTLQDAVDLDMATTEEAALLTAWKKYRVLLNRVDISTAPDIDWPQKPQ
ncbi:tail fiber assembly protein [Morganella morganii]|uniref:tail fiber assembly protein n=1 Tax=Morganella morganii TaxID=582 RepID=UPI00288352AB|nr:tail fiber assembly protein [Morganella morganii]